MLPKKFRLPAKKFAEMRNLKCNKSRGKYGMFVMVENDLHVPRFGFIVSKKIGNAVIRHKMTRLLRVIVMELINEMNLLDMSVDFQYIAFEFCGEKSNLKKDIKELFKKIV